MVSIGNYNGEGAATQFAMRAQLVDQVGRWRDIETVQPEPDLPQYYRLSSQVCQLWEGQR